MGIIKAAVGAVDGALADQWLEAIEPLDMGEKVVFVKGVKVRQGESRSSNNKGTDDVISNGSIIHVYDNQFMLLVDGGKVVDYTAEPGYYKVDNSSAPSLFNGQFGPALKDVWERIKFGGGTPKKQLVYFINLQEIKGIKFGTPNPVQYFDCFYNAELFMRAHGTYSIKVTDPLKFYMEAIPRNAEHVAIDDINEQYLAEFLQAFQAAINQLSVQGERISFLSSKGPELSKHMSDVLDESWNDMRGMQVQAVGIASISYDEESQKLINMRNQGAMMGDPNIREGYVQSAVATGIQSAGANEAGAGAAFMGVGMGMNAMGGMGSFSQTNAAQMQQQQQPAAAAGWTCSCGAKVADNAKFCPQCGGKKPEPVADWVCSCGKTVSGSAKFCPECGGKKAEAKACPKCGATVAPNAKFCPECGEKM